MSVRKRTQIQVVLRLAGMSRLPRRSTNGCLKSAGWGQSAVSPSNIEQVKRYIANQEEHHRRMSFQDEFRELCKRHGIEIDERYVWD